jgi:tetratricopeptide (TPR) repeat protein
MSQRVGSRRVLTAFAAVVVGLGAGFGGGSPLGADVIQTIDGKWFPPSEPPLGPTDKPGDDLLAQTQDHKLDATYETVKLVGAKGTTKPAGQVVQLFSSARVGAEFRQALSDAEGNYWQEAADGFGAAAQAAQGFGKQEAMWLRVQAFWYGQFPDEMNTAIDELLQAFPKSYYYAEAQILRARLAAGQQKTDAAVKALDSVKAQPGMNLRDQFRAEYMRVYLTLDAQRKVDEALSGYQKLVEWIDKADATLGETTRLQALVGIGNAHVAKGNVKDALAAFTKASESKNVDVLAGAYTGLGDIAFGEAKALRDNKDLEGSKKKLETAIQHYLRVTQFYRPNVEEMDAVLRALGNQAKAFTVLFDMTRDLEAGKRAWAAYKDLSNALGDGPAKKQVVRDWQDFDKRLKEFEATTKKPAPPKPAAPKDGAPPAGEGK